ncbi:MAG: alpha/beta hydrolase family protein [Sphingomonas sp.]
MRTLAFLPAAAILAAVAAPVPAQIGATTPPVTRAPLIDALNEIAAKDEAARRETVAAIRTPADIAARQKHVRETILRLLGNLPADNPPLAARVTHTIHQDGFDVQTVIYDSEPGQHVTANLFLPTGGGKHPAVIISPGHGPNGKAGDYAFAANFARNGFVALAWDIVDQGERREYFDPVIGASRAERPTGAHSVAAFQSLVTGLPIASRFLRDEMRGVDFLASRPEVDAQRIGAFGCSGGGTATAYLGAMYPRVKAVATACFVTDFDHLLGSIGPQDGEQSIPGFIAAGLDIADWVELAAPKPYAVISTTEDMFPFAGATAAVNEARRFWDIQGAGDRFHWFTGPGLHGAITPMADKIIGFFRDALNADAPARPFTPLRPDDPAQLNATETGLLATSQSPGKTMASLAAERAAAVAPKARPDAATITAAIRRLAGVSKAVPSAALSGDTLTIAAPIGPIAAKLVRPAAAPSRAVLLIGSGRLADMRAKALAAEGATVVVLTPRGADGTEEIKATIVGDENLLALRAMLVGKTLTGLRIDDALGALGWLEANVKAPLSIEGIGEAGPVALQAALLDRKVTSVRAIASQISIRAAVDRLMQRELPPIAVPGMLTAYDLPDVIAALAPRRVELFAPIDPVGVPLDRADYRKLLGGLADDPRVRFSPYPTE